MGILIPFIINRFYFHKPDLAPSHGIHQKIHLIFISVALDRQRQSHKPCRDSPKPRLGIRAINPVYQPEKNGGDTVAKPAAPWHGFSGTAKIPYTQNHGLGMLHKRLGHMQDILCKMLPVPICRNVSAPAPTSERCRLKRCFDCRPFPEVFPMMLHNTAKRLCLPENIPAFRGAAVIHHKNPQKSHFKQLLKQKQQFFIRI
nr:hypothetical protein [uncultured Acetatifactor sp.]